MSDHDATLGVRGAMPPRRGFDPFWFIDPDFKPDVGIQRDSSPLKVAWYYCTLPGMGIAWRLATVGSMLALYLGVALAANGPVGTSDLFGIFTVVVTGYLAFYGILLLDDVLDQKADAVAHPERPLPSNSIRVRDYWIVILTCGNIAVALNLWLDWTNYVFAHAAGLFAGLLMFLQGRMRVPAFGELAMPVIWALLPLYAFWVLDREHMGHGLLLAAFLYLADMAQDIPGGINDHHGDERQGVRTFFMSLGAPGAARLALILFSLSTLPLAAFLWLRGLPWFAYVECALIFAWTAAAYVRLLKSQDERTCILSRFVGFLYFNFVLIVIAGAVVYQTLFGAPGGPRALS
jgi:4-hydroxybenzoate polyprenyltransferase